MATANIGGLIIAIVITTSAVNIYGSYLNIQEGDVRLVGGDTGIEGRAQIYHDGEWVNICFSAGQDHEWEFPEGDTFCKQLGYTRGSALVLDGATTRTKYGNGGGDTFLTNVDCYQDTDNGLLGCANVEWGSSCQNRLGLVGVVCRLPAFVGCYLYGNPGFLTDHKIIVDLMTIDKCLDGCQEAPGPFKYAALVNRVETVTGIIADCNCGMSSSVLPSTKEADHQCYELCPGDDAQTCGAFMRAAVYDLDGMRNGHTAPNIIWPSWGRDYNFGDNGDLWRISITGYDYAVLRLLSLNLANGDSVIFRSQSRSYGTTISNSVRVYLPYRWVSNSAAWFEVETRVRPTSPGDDGFIIYYEFGRLCDATDLPDIAGGSWDNVRGGVYYEHECPDPYCAPGYAPSSTAVCQLDGTWTGTVSCYLVPTPRRTLFPIDRATSEPTTIPDEPSTTPRIESTTPRIESTTPRIESTTPRIESTTPSLAPPVTQPTIPPVTQTPPPVTQPPTDPPIQQPQCALPVINSYGELLGTSGSLVFDQGDRITHCCIHNVFERNCLVLTCLAKGIWENGAYLNRCEPPVCPVPTTNAYGSIGGTGDKSYFIYGDEISLCCTSSDYCYVLRCRWDGTWDNGDELLGCPAPIPRPTTDTAIPLWAIIVIVVAGVIGLILVVVCLCVICFQPRRQYDDKRVLTREYRKEKPANFIEPREGQRYPPPPHYLRDEDHAYRPRSDRPRSDQYSQQPSSAMKKTTKPPLGPTLAVDRPSKQPQDYSQYAKYGARPLHRASDYRAPKPPSSHRAEQRSDRSRPRTEGDEASALGALNSVVQDLEANASRY